MTDEATWKEFKKFAKAFYTDCMEIASNVAGAENANTTQIMLRQISPNLLELFTWWEKHHPWWEEHAK